MDHNTNFRFYSDLDEQPMLVSAVIWFKTTPSTVFQKKKNTLGVWIGGQESLEFGSGILNLWYLSKMQINVEWNLNSETKYRSEFQGKGL